MRTPPPLPDTRTEQASPDPATADPAGVRLVLVAAVALLDATGRVLIAQRPPGKRLAGLWEFPGGKVEAGERPEETAVRELKEELAVDLAERALEAFSFASHDYGDFHLLMPLYLARRWRGAPTPQDAQAIAWAPIAQLGDYEMPPADLPLVAQLQKAAAAGAL